MREIPTRPKQHSGSAVESRAAEALQRQEADSASGREKLEDTLGGALTRVLSRAGLSVRVVPTAQGSGAAEEAARSHPPAAAPSATSHPADDAAACLPARDELITLFTIVLAGKVLGQLPAGAFIETAAVSEPAAPEAPDSGPGSQPVPPAAPPAAIPWKALPSPPVTGPAPQKPAAPARLPPVTAAPAPAPAASKPTAAPVKGRGFTIRY